MANDVQAVSLHKALEQGLDSGNIVITPGRRRDRAQLLAFEVAVYAYGCQLWEGNLASVWRPRDKVVG